MSVQAVVDRAHGLMDNIEEPVEDLSMEDIKSEAFQDIFHEFKKIDKYITYVQNHIGEFEEEAGSSAFEEYESMVDRFDDINSSVEETIKKVQKNQVAQSPGAGAAGQGGPGNIVDFQGS